MRPMERAAFFSAWATKKLRGVCVCGSGLYGNAATRMSEIVPADRTYAYGSYPDIEALYKQQAVETDRKKREALLYQIQQVLHERVRFAPVFEYVWPSGIGPRVAEPALMLINPYPWSAPPGGGAAQEEVTSFATAPSTTVPVKKSGFIAVWRRAGFEKTNSRRSASVMRPCSTSS